jgi:type I restriction enzyme R subunit
MKYDAIDIEIKTFADKWFLNPEDVKYEVFNFKYGEIANENKLKENANYSEYKEKTDNPLPKFKFNSALIRDFKEELMPLVEPLLLT